MDGSSLLGAHCPYALDIWENTLPWAVAVCRSIEVLACSRHILAGPRITCIEFICISFIALRDQLDPLNQNGVHPEQQSGLTTGLHYQIIIPIP